MDREKVVGATGFEPATPCAQGRVIASSCDVMRNIDGIQLIDPKRFDARNHRTSLGQKSRVEPRWNPKRYRLSRRIWADPLSWTQSVRVRPAPLVCRSSPAASTGVFVRRAMRGHERTGRKHFHSPPRRTNLRSSPLVADWRRRPSTLRIASSTASNSLPTSSARKRSTK